MTDPFDFERLLEARLKAHAAGAIRAFDATAITATAVARAPRRAAARSWLGPWQGRGSRSAAMRIAVIGLLLVAAAVGAVLVGAVLRDRQPIPDRLALVPPSASPAPSVPPSASPAPSAPSGGPLDDALRATWLAFASEDPVLQTGAGPVSLSVSPIGTGIDAANFGPGHGYASLASNIGPDLIEVALDRAAGDCAAGARGVYRSLLSDDRSQLTLTVVSEDCSSRGLVFARRWVRSLATPGSVGAGIVTTLEPNFTIALPDDTYESRTTLPDFIEIAGINGSLLVFKNPQLFVDSCSTAEERVPYQPGAAAFVEAFRNNDAFDLGKATELKVGGHGAIQVTVRAKANYARCPGQELYEYTPKACQCHFVLGQGDAETIYLVDVDADTFLFSISPFSNEVERQIVDSIRIPAQLPAQ